MTHLNRKLAATILLVVTLSLVGCSTWEQTTYQSLASSKAVIDAAAQGFVSADGTATIQVADGTTVVVHVPRTAEMRTLIMQAQSAQTIAVLAFHEYASVKVAAQPSSTVAQKRTAVISAVADLVPLVTQIQQALKLK